MTDKTFHLAFKQDVDYCPPLTRVNCRNCGTRLKVYYAGKRLYAVKCGYCETITLVKANNAVEATRCVGEYAEEAYVFKRGTEDGKAD